MSSEQSPLLGAQQQHAQPPYTTFTQRQKLLILIAATVASVFSPLSANIYYPALQSIGTELKVSESLLNLTITSYMIFQGLSPALIGSYSDTIGRRPIYIFCFTTYIVANIALAASNSFISLLLLRCLQSTGSSSTVNLALGVMADLVTSSERGRYIALTSAGPILAPGLGPVLGGVITQYLGWRYVFIVLAAAALLFLILLLLFLPETCRSVVGDGSIPPKSAWNKSFVAILSSSKNKGKNKNTNTSRDQDANGDSSTHDNDNDNGNDNQTANKDKKPSPFKSLTLLLTYPTSPIIVFTGLTFGIYYAIMASLSDSFLRIYAYTSVQIGLAYLPISLGTIAATLFNGVLVDWNYRRLARRANIPGDQVKNMDFKTARRLGFSFVKARLQIALPAALFSALCMLGYGWSMSARTSPVVPLILLFGFGWGNAAAFFVMSLLIVDINSSSAAAAAGANNLVRCFVGAAGAGIVLPMIERLGEGWTFSVLTGVWVVCSPLVVALLFGKERENEREEDDDE